MRRLDAALAAYSITQRAKANIPGTNEYGQTGERYDAAQSVESTAKTVEACYQRYTALVRKNQATRQRPTFAFTNGWVDDATRAYEKARVDAHSMLDRNWLQKLKSAILNEAKGPYARQATKYVVLGAIGAAVAWVLLADSCTVCWHRLRRVGNRFVSFRTPMAAHCYFREHVLWKVQVAMGRPRRSPSRSSRVSCWRFSLNTFTAHRPAALHRCEP